MSSTSITEIDKSPWLTTRQALSWVMYRDPDLPEVRDFYDKNLHPHKGGEKIVQEPKQIGTRQELVEALQSGRIAAHTRQRAGDYRQISKIEWLDRRVTPHVDLNPAYVERDELLKVFKPTRGKTPTNRQLDHNAIRRRAAEMRAEQPNISIGSAAASIAAGLPPNPKTGKQRDTRGIERIIANLWKGDSPTVL